MRPQSLDPVERLLTSAAETSGYPRTPDVSAEVHAAILSLRSRPRSHRSWAVALIIVILLAIAAAVPQARALVTGWFRIGIIQIEPAPLNASPVGSETPISASPAFATPAAFPDSLLPPSLAGLTGITTLDEVERRGRIPVALPRYPPDLGEPDVVVFQPQLDLLALAWLDPADRSRVTLALFEFLSGNPIARKADPTVLAETAVGSSPALWVEGPYPLQVAGGEFEWRRVVAGRSLLWERDGITFRLETELSLDEALRIAESIP